MNTERGPTSETLRARVLELRAEREHALEEALRLELCNGCFRPRAEWGPYCGYMTVGDQTHFHSREFWRRRLGP